jgi:hypothetical protein
MSHASQLLALEKFDLKNSIYCYAGLFLREAVASSISIAGPDALKVKGCVGGFCGGETWSRSAR